ncbi:MAG: tetratricopeptide repeat protein [Kiritimatiellae bacterium]|nr:tetratricopeptide repeat protein [Kiritimatiellia bacterium]
MFIKQIVLLVEQVEGLLDESKHQEAVRLIEQALELFMRKPKRYQQQVEHSLQSVTARCTTPAEYRQAESLWMRVIAINERWYGANAVELVPGLNALAEINYKMKCYMFTALFYRLSHTIQMESKNKDYPTFVYTLYQLCEIGRRFGSFNSTTIYRRALALAFRHCPDSPVLPSLWLGLGRKYVVFRDSGERAKAKKCFGKALSSAKKKYGPISAVGAKANVDLGDLYVQEGEFGRAMDLYRTALKMEEVMYGENAYQSWRTHKCIAECFAVQFELHDAEKHYGIALNLAEQTPELDEGAITELAGNHARICAALGKTNKAVSLYEHALANREGARSSTSHLDHPKYKLELAHLYRATGQIDQALYTFKSLFHDSPPMVLPLPEHYQGLVDMANLYLAQNQLSIAEELFKTAIVCGKSRRDRRLNCRKRAFSTEDHLRLAEVLESIAGIYEKSRRPKQAREAKKEAQVIRANPASPGDEFNC